MRSRFLTTIGTQNNDYHDRCLLRLSGSETKFKIYPKVVQEFDFKLSVRFFLCSLYFETLSNSHFFDEVFTKSKAKNYFPN